MLIARVFKTMARAQEEELEKKMQDAKTMDLMKAQLEATKAAHAEAARVDTATAPSPSKTFSLSEALDQALTGTAELSSRTEDQ